MHEALAGMLAKYESARLEDTMRALREIMQEIALLGLWRSKFFEKAAFYGGTAMRVLYGLDRFSEDLDFSLLKPMSDFDIANYLAALQKELEAFGFDVRPEQRNRAVKSAVQSAFLKANTLNQLLVIETAEEILHEVPRGQVLKIKLEVDTDPPSGFSGAEDKIGGRYGSAVRIFNRDKVFAAADPVCREGLHPAGSVCRQDARDSVPQVENTGERPRLVRSGVVCRQPPAASPVSSGAAHAAERSLEK
jgi:hypothetical protein